jgi:hypothetical protein
MSFAQEILTELKSIPGITISAEVVNPGASEEELKQLSAVLPVDASMLSFYREMNGCRISWKGSLRPRQWGVIQFRTIENLLAENGLLFCDEMNPESDIRLVTGATSVDLVEHDYDGHSAEPHYTFPQLLEILKLTRGYFNWQYYLNVYLNQTDLNFLPEMEGDLKALFPDFSYEAFNPILAK